MSRANDCSVLVAFCALTPERTNSVEGEVLDFARRSCVAALAVVMLGR